MNDLARYVEDAFIINCGHCAAMDYVYNDSGLDDAVAELEALGWTVHSDDEAWCKLCSADVEADVW